MTFQPTIRSQQDLEDAWRTLIGPLGFADHSIWVMLIDPDDRPIPQLSRLEDAEAVPGPEELRGLAQVFHEVCAEVAPGGRIAFLRSRPGGAGVTANDRAWARGLYDACRSSGVPVEVVHRASDADLVPIPMDEALPAAG